MFPRHTHRLLLLPLTLTWLGAAHTAPVNPPPKESLPKGVRARLGSVPAAAGDAVEAVAFSADARRLASAHHDHTLRLWESASGKKLAQFRGPDRPVAWLVFSPDGRSLLTGTAEEVDLWDTASGKRLARLHAADQRVVLAAMGPDGRARAWTEDARHTIHCWDVGTQKEICSSAGHTDRILSIALSPDSAVLASSSQDGTVRLWDATSGKILRQLKTRFDEVPRLGRRDPQPVVLRLQFAPNDWMLFGSGAGANYYLWETGTGGLIHSYERRVRRGKKVEDGGSRRGAQVFTPGSRVLLWVTEGEEGSLSWHDVGTFASIGGMGTGEQKVVTALAFAPDGSCLATAGSEGTILLWERRSLPWNRDRTRRTLDEKHLAECWKDLGSTDGNRIYSASWTLALGNGQTVAFLQGHLRPASKLSADEVRKLLAALDDGDAAERERAFIRLVAAGESAEQELRKASEDHPSAEVRQKVGAVLAEIARPRLVRSLQILEQINTPPARQLLNELAAGASGAWRTRQAEASCKRLAGRLVADVSTDEPPTPPPGPLPKFIVTDGPPAVPRQPGRDSHGDPLPQGATARIGTLRLRHQGEARAVAFSPDGKLLASGGDDDAVRLWDTATGEQRMWLRGHQRDVLAVAFSSDGRLLASADAGGEVVLWDVRSGQEVERFRPGGSDFFRLAFGPGDRSLAVMSNGGEGTLWDLTTGRRRHHWRGGRMGTRPLAEFTPDGKTFFHADEGQIVASDPITDKQLRQLKPPSSDLLALKVMKDGRVLAAATLDQRTGGVAVSDVSNGREIRRFDRVSAAGCAAFSPDGRILAVGGHQYSWISLCDLASGRERELPIDQQQYGINGIVFSPDGKWLASADASGNVQLWDVARAEERVLKDRVRGGVRCWLSGDGRILATIEIDWRFRPHTLCLWETSSGRLIRRISKEYAEFTAIAFSPNGALLATGVDMGDGENMVLLWDAATGKLLRRCRGPREGKIDFLAFAPDGASLAGGQAGRVRLWSARTGEELRIFAGTDLGLKTGAFAADGKSLATASEDGNLRIWDVASGRELRRRTGHGSYPVTGVAFSADGRLLASVGGDDFVSLWDTHDYRRLRRLPFRRDWFSCMAFSSDGRLVAANDGDDGFVVWDADTGRARYRTAGHAAGVLSLGFGADGKTVVSGSRDGTALVWDLKSLPFAVDAGQPEAKTDRLGDPLPPGALARLGSIRFHHESSVHSVAFSPDGKTMATGSAGNPGTSVRMWELATGRQLRLFHDYPSWIRQVAFSPDGKLLAGASGGDVTFWDAATGERRGRIKAHHDNISRFAFSPNSKLVATADQPYNDPNKDFAIRVWDVAEGQQVHQFHGHHAEVTDLVFSTDGKRLASCSLQSQKEWEIFVWDLETGKLQRHLHVNGTAAQFSPDGRTLAVREGKMIRLRDIETDKPVSEVRAPNKDAYFLFAPDGQSLAVEGADGVRLYRVATGDLLRTIPNSAAKDALFGLHGPVGFSPDGKLLVTYGLSAVHLWDADTGREVRPFGGHRGLVTCVTFSPAADGGGRERPVLASGGSDGTVRVWEATTGREIVSFARHEKGITVISFSPDGRTVASADHGGTVWLWSTATGQELRRLGDLPGEATSLMFTTDGRRLLACTSGGAVRVWETATGKVLHRGDGVPGTSRWHRPAALAQDGRLLVEPRVRETDLGGGGSDPLVCRNVKTGRVLRTLRGSQQPYDFLTFTGDGRFLAAMGYHIDHFHGHVNDAGVRLWETAGGEEVLCLEELSTPFVFSADGGAIACSWASPRESPCGVQCWDAATGRRLGRVAGHLDPVTDLAFSADGRLLATGSLDGTVLVWDARPLTRHRPPPVASAPRHLDDLWADLAGTDAARAYDALWTLVRRPKEAVPLLGDHLRPVPPPVSERIARWIADLDSAEFEVRRKAAVELEQLGELAEPALRKAMADRPSLEVRRRLGQLLESLDRAAYPPDQLRAFRAVAVLERIGDAPARRLLERLARGALGSHLTQEAQASLTRLDRRGPPP